MSKEPQSKPTPDDSSPVKESPPQLATLPRSYIVRSKTNPRTHFDADYIKELAGSIREHGILQPILVRPLPGSRVQETFEDRAPGAPAPTHEIVCGECRWRACEAAGVEQLPVLVRHLSDLQVLQVQLVENLKRRDLHPLEEAEGFDRLIKDHGLAVEDIAARVDKSASQIYVTLKLLELTPECRDELYAGKLTRSTALLVARAPAYLQTKIAKDIMHSGFDGEPMSYRQAQRHIQQHYMLQLANAVFDIKDASLVAKAGACSSCSKNTGASSDMFEDVKGGDTCTDPKCFDAKKGAHFAGVAKAAAAKGQVVIQGKEAAALFPTEFSQPKGYHLLDSKDYINGSYTTLRKLVGKDALASVLIINPHTKEAQEALPTAVANKLIKKADGQKKDKRKAAANENLEEQFSEGWKTRVVEQVHSAIISGPTPGITVAIARHIADYYQQSLGSEGGERFARLFNVEGARIGGSNAIAEFIKTCPDAMVGPALLVLMLEDDLDAYNGKLELATLITADAGVDIQEVQAEVKAQMREAAQAKSDAPAKKEGKAKPAPAKKATKKTGQAAFMNPLMCSIELQAVVGTEPLPRVEIVSKLWAYVKRHKLQDTVNKRMVNADEKLRAVFGKDQVSMFEMAGLLGKHTGYGSTPAKPGKSKKTSAAEAKAGISKTLDAVQPAGDNLPAEIGSRVRIKEGVKRVAKYSGREGVLGPFMGDMWKVDFDGLNSCRAKRDEFAVLAAPLKLAPMAAWPLPTKKPAVDAARP